MALPNFDESIYSIRRHMKHASQSDLFLSADSAHCSLSSPCVFYHVLMRPFMGIQCTQVPSSLAESQIVIFKLSEVSGPLFSGHFLFIDIALRYQDMICASHSPLTILVHLLRAKGFECHASPSISEMDRMSNLDRRWMHQDSLSHMVL